MAAVMLQEGIWYLLIGLYGPEAPPWVVMVLNWSNMSSTLTLVLIAIEPIMELPFDTLYDLLCKLYDRWTRPPPKSYKKALEKADEEEAAEEEDEETDVFEEYRRRTLAMTEADRHKHLIELQNSPVFDTLTPDEALYHITTILLPYYYHSNAG
jgi:hypothetical protein